MEDIGKDLEKLAMTPMLFFLILTMTRRSSMLSNIVENIEMYYTF